MINSGRMDREAKTVKEMIARYCRLKHGTTEELCSECTELLNYSKQRLQNCPFQEGKTSCGKCKIHCYKPAMREKICEVMRTIGPRMLVTNPGMSICHFFDGLRKTPVVKKKNTKNCS